MLIQVLWVHADIHDLLSHVHVCMCLQAGALNVNTFYNIIINDADRIIS